MTLVSRQWATPLVIGAFALMGVTGSLMFFHADSGVQKAVHEWLGWLLIGAVAAHAFVHWGAFKRYLQVPGWGRWIIAACLVGLSVTFLPLPGSSGPQASAPPPVLAMRAVAAAPLKSVAPLAGKTVEQAQRDLAAAGVKLADGEQSIASVVQADRERLGRAMRALFGPATVTR